MRSDYSRLAGLFRQWTRRLMLIVAALVLPLSALLATPLSVAAAAEAKPATDVFVGTATTGNATMPVDLDYANAGAGPNGSLSVPYTYRAIGSATGDVKGRFVYAETGYLYVDPTTSALVGSSFRTGVFTLTPDKKGAAPISIVDTNPEAYTHGTETVDRADLPKSLAKVYRALADQTGTVVTHGALTYGYFTFTNHYGTFKGIATPDFRQFAIRVTFDAPKK